MKCYYHIEREAVGTCQDCGKALCQDCASKYTPCLCTSCYQKRVDAREQQRANKKREHLYKTKKEFLLAIEFGVIIAVIVFAVLHFVMGYKMNMGNWELVAASFFVTFGWPFTDFAYIPTRNPMVSIVLFALRLIMSYIIGIPCFAYHVIKLVKGIEQNRRM